MIFIKFAAKYLSLQTHSVEVKASLLWCFPLMNYLSYFQTTSLKSCCEYALKLHIDDETALYLISLADQLNAKVLKVCYLYIIRHLDIYRRHLIYVLLELFHFH